VTEIDVLVAALDRLQEIISLDKRHCYRINKAQVPGVTTVIRVLDAPQLDAWKVRVQVEGTARAAHQNPPKFGEDVEVYVSRLAEIAAEQFEHERIAKQAADVGTQVHALIEHEIKARLGKPTVAPEAGDEALFIFSGWKEWAERVGLKPLAAESRIVHPTMNYCGTFDLLALVNDEPAVIDWKPSPRVYDERRLQSAAYRAALNAMGWPQLKGYIVAMPRDGGEIEMVSLEEDISVPFAAFQNCLALYQWRRELARKERKEIAAA
jgi:hypothetical protein